MIRRANILVTSAGRRVGLVQAFRRAGHDLGAHTTVHACDMDPALSAGCSAADFAFAVPRCDHPDYIDVLLAYCRAKGISLLVPTIDSELAALARSVDRFAAIGCRVHVGTPELIDIVRDNVRTCALLTVRGVPAPRTYTPDEARLLSDTSQWPLFSKPSDGSASRGLCRVDRPEDIPATHDEPTIFQDYLHGPEFTVNVFVDRYGDLRCAIPHLRIQTRAGEVEKGRTVRDPRFTRIARDLIAALPGPRGVMCFQLIDDERRGLCVFKIKARFGGGFPLADHAGATFARWLVAEVLDLDSGASDKWRDGIEMIRYDAAFFRSSGAVAE